MNTESDDVASTMPSQVDRLVCGELDESARQKLLAWLEAEPARWRMCGVAFLEAQAWSRAIERWPRADDQSCSSAGATLRLAPGQSRRRALVRQATIAAAVVIAFGLGIAFRDFSAAAQRAAETADVSGDVPGGTRKDLSNGDSNLPSKQESVLASLNVETGDGFGHSTPIHFPVVPAAIDENHLQEHAEIPDYVRQQWERRGYKVSLERRFLFAKLADGQKVVVPVDQLRVNPLPIHVN